MRVNNEGDNYIVRKNMYTIHTQLQMMINARVMTVHPLEKLISLWNFILGTLIDLQIMEGAASTND